MRGMMMKGRTAAIAVLFLLVKLQVFAQVSPAQVSPAQVSSSNIFSTGSSDYTSLSLNPANIAAHNRDDRKNFSLGFIAMNTLLYSRGVKLGLLHGRGTDNFGNASYWLDRVLIEKNAINVDNMILGFNFSANKTGSQARQIGNFAFSITNNIYAEAEINGVLEEIDFENASELNIEEVINQLMEDESTSDENSSYMKMRALNNFNFGYSRKVLNDDKIKVFAGIGMKYVLGFADFGLRFNGHEMTGYSALSSLLPEEWEENNYATGIRSDKKFGHGFGTSLGGSLIAGKWRAGVSVLDLGFIKWPSNQLYITREDVTEVAIEEKDVDEALTRMRSEFLRKENGMERLPARMVIGGSFEAHHAVHFFMDVVSPIMKAPGGMSNPTIGLGTMLVVRRSIALKTGATLVSKRLVTMPLHLSFFGGKRQAFEMAFGTSDIIGIFKPTRAYINFDMALMKFHF